MRYPLWRAIFADGETSVVDATPDHPRSLLTDKIAIERHGEARVQRLDSEGGEWQDCE
jgi:hypothetical protein